MYVMIFYSNYNLKKIAFKMENILYRSLRNLIYLNLDLKTEQK